LRGAGLSFHDHRIEQSLATAAEFLEPSSRDFDKVLWGADSIFYSSPQRQVEALRRIEIPEDPRRKFGYEPLAWPMAT